MSFPRTAIIAIILASFLGTVHSILHNVTRLGGNQEVDFPLQSGEINGTMVIVDSRQVSGYASTKKEHHFDSNTFCQISGQRVKLACINWMGFHLEDLVINGLDRGAFL